MCGNVWEWTLSLYKPYPYREGKGSEYEEANEDEYRIRRGGSWGYGMERARVTSRVSGPPTMKHSGLGFRVVAAPELKS
jgi:formylglycine-generating enzyme required for sulfatase activity